VEQQPDTFPLWLSTRHVDRLDAVNESNLSLDTSWIVFRFVDINFGFTSAVRRLVTLSLFCLVMGRHMGIASQGWHYAPNSSWETFFDRSTLAAAPADEHVQFAARDSRHRRVAYFYRPSNYSRLLQRHLHLAEPSVYAAARQLLLSSLWRPNNRIKARVRDVVCASALRSGTYAVMHVRRGDKTSGALREIPESSVVPLAAYLDCIFSRKIRTLFVMSDDYLIVNETRVAVERAFLSGRGSVTHVVSLVPSDVRGHQAHLPLSATDANDAFERFIVELEIARHAQFVVGDHRSNVLSLIALLHDCGNESCVVENTVPLQYCIECTPCVLSLAPREACIRVL